MKKKKIGCIFLTLGLLFVGASSVFASSKEEIVKASVDTTKDYYYLSDIEVDSYKVGWGDLQLDKNIDGGSISLMLENNRVYYNKGIGAHANSEIIYDLTDYVENYPHLVGYMGLDASKGNNGDGIKMAIYASTSLSGTWVKLQDTVTLKGNSNAAIIDSNLAGYKYIKLYANQNTNNGYDHAVYADIRITKSNYDVTVEDYQGIKKISYYDNILSANDADYNYDNNYSLVLKRELVNRLGYYTIQNAVKDDEKIGTALDWLLSSDENLSIFLESGMPYNGSVLKTLSALGALYDEYSTILNTPSGDNLIYKKMLLATAVAYCKDIKSYVTTYGGSSHSSDPVVKFKAIKYLYDNNLLYDKEQFKKLSPELVRMVMDARMEDDEILWLNNYASSKENKWSGYSYMNYVNVGYGQERFYSQDEKASWISKYNLNYNDPVCGSSLLDSYGEENRYRIWMMMEAGGICWGISGCGTNVSEVNGRPATNMYQPGHDAYLVYKEDANGNGLWEVWNNVSGWGSMFSRWGNNTNSEARIMLGWGLKDYNNFNKNNGAYILLAQAALNDYSNYKKSMIYNFIANSYENGSDEREATYMNALSTMGINLDSFDGLIDSYTHSNKTDTEWMDLAQRIVTEYTYYPLPMVEALNRISSHLTDDVNKVSLETIKNNALLTASKATATDSLQSDACIAVANSLLQTEDSSLASFSFSGENANKIILNSKYDSYNLVVKYSLDNGTTFKQTSDHKINLNATELASINSADDIIVSIVGSNENYLIDIKDGETISANNICLNDDENKLFGKIDYLEYSLDNGSSWHEYTSQSSFNGNANILVRYKAHDNYLASQNYTFTFTKNTVDSTMQYISIDKLEFVSVSSQQGGVNGTGSNLIDGSSLTSWHTKWSYKDPDKYAIIKLKDSEGVKYISKISIDPGDGNNGKPKQLEIYTSLDGNNWKKVYASVDDNSYKGGIPLDGSRKEFVFNEAAPAKYIKVVAISSYGNSVGEADMYFSARRFNFYEDTTKDFINEATYTLETNENCNGVKANINFPIGSTYDSNNEINFTKNGSYKVEYMTYDGTSKTIDIVINTIDDISPTGVIKYDEKSNGRIRAYVSELSETVTYKDNVSEYYFTSNGSYDFVFYDKAGNMSMLTAIINDFDKSEPLIAEIEYHHIDNYTIKASIDRNKLNKNIVNPDSDLVHIFTENGAYTFTLEDFYGEKYSLVAHVSTIDKIAPTATINYTRMTDGTVVAEVTDLSEEVIFGIDNGRHKFTENGEYEFVFTDLVGNETRLVATVTSIDKVPPTGRIEYIKSITGTVLARVVDLSEPVTFKDNVSSHIFEENGSFDFVIIDASHNSTTLTATVSDIDIILPTATIHYIKTNDGSVIATVDDISEKVTFKDDTNIHVFSSSGTFDFELDDEYGNKIILTAAVSNINKCPTQWAVTYSITEEGNMIAKVVDVYENVSLDGSNGEYLFTENGTHDFAYTDSNGAELVVSTAVSMLDKTPPTGEIEYIHNSDDSIVAKVVNLSEEVTFENDISEYTFTVSGTYVFKFWDLWNNVTELTATANITDTTAPTGRVEYVNNSDGTITARVIDLSEEVTYVSAESYTFEYNGTYMFIFKDSAGNTGSVLAEVSSLSRAPEQDNTGDDDSGDTEIIDNTDVINIKGNTFFRVMAIAVIGIAVIICVFVIIYRKKIFEDFYDGE